MYTDNAFLLGGITLAEERMIIKDEIQEVKTRFISFKSNHQRFDLALVHSDQYQGKTMVIDLGGNRFTIMDKEDAAKEGNLEHEFHLTEVRAEELRKFLVEVLD
ncbi:DUF3055 family protein [Sediminibacillus dalangtanensis]|uniref:DUF3055 family protein n=1 Tax=Sediminibacillus dalangtanensis TaxID=2729421 RepID=A0ABX7VXF9_9BACI|nr:DUF3055 family protein [Sediminibacillus dalangtanensis]